MQTLPLIWSAIWPTLAILAAVAAMLLVALLVNLRYALRTDPERMSAEDGGSGQVPLVRCCMYCERVLNDPPITLHAGQPLRVSHGCCDECKPKLAADLGTKEWKPLELAHR